MPKRTPTAFQRTREFPNSGLVVSKGKLFCTACSEVVDYMKKTVVSNHLGTKTHIKNKGSVTLQLPLDEVLSRNETEKEQWSSMVKAFVAAGIPLHVFRRPQFANWMKTNVKKGENLPSETTLRKILEQEGQRDLEVTRNICQGKDVIIVVDETQDIQNRKIVNLLVKPADSAENFRLFETKLVDKCNAEIVSQLIVKSVQGICIDISNVVAVISDNAPYMIAAGKLLCQLNSRCIHSTCWAHILHLVSEEIRSSCELADTFIANVKGALVKAPARRLELLDTLEEQGKARKLPPTPVLTRWTTWLEAAHYLFENRVPVIQWIRKTVNDSRAIGKLKLTAESPALFVELEKISTIFTPLSTVLKQLEANDIPASDVRLHLQTILGLLAEDTTWQGASKKLELYMTQKHPSLQFWNEVEFCDPRKFHKFRGQPVPESIRKLSKEPIPLNEMAAYRSICEGFDSDSNFNPVKFWKSHVRELPILSKACLKALSFPPSSAEVERSFSFLKKLLRPERNRLTEDNLAIHLKIQFNSRCMEKEVETELLDDSGGSEDEEEMY